MWIHSVHVSIKLAISVTELPHSTNSARIIVIHAIIKHIYGWKLSAISVPHPTQVSMWRCWRNSEERSKKEAFPGKYIRPYSNQLRYVIQLAKSETVGSNFIYCTSQDVMEHADHLKPRFHSSHCEWYFRQSLPHSYWRIHIGSANCVRWRMFIYSHSQLAGIAGSWDATKSVFCQVSM